MAVTPFWSAVGENRMPHAHFTSLCVIDAELLAMEFLHCALKRIRPDAGIRCVCGWYGPFSVLWPWPNPNPMTFIYELDPHCLEIHRMCKYLYLVRLSKVVWQTHIHTYIHTERQNWDFWRFCSCDLDLDPMTFIYELDSHSLEIKANGCAKINFLRRSFRKLSIVLQTDRQTDKA